MAELRREASRLDVAVPVPELFRRWSLAVEFTLRALLRALWKMLQIARVDDSMRLCLSLVPMHTKDKSQLIQLSYRGAPSAPTFQCQWALPQGRVGLIRKAGLLGPVSRRLLSCYLSLSGSTGKGGGCLH